MSDNKFYRLGCDIGGTFTDFVLLDDETGEMRINKCLTTPSDPSDAVEKGIRELEEKRVVVLPALIEDCEIPLFLRGKMYADFRSNFDKGLRDTLEAISRVTSEGLGRYEGPEWTIDWAIDHEYIDNIFSMRITVVEQAQDQPYCVITEIIINANKVATERYRRFEEEGIDWIERGAIVHELARLSKNIDLRLLLEDEQFADLVIRYLEDSYFENSIL